MANTNSDYLRDDFLTVTPGEPFRLFPFGKIVKNGKARVITPELARSFKLPHFKPPIKLGSHTDTTPAGGHIVSLEVREDGLYAVPEFNDQGAQALRDGAYRYHSPEVIWDDSGLEDPTTGAILSGPMILGDALLHTPHLGEATALYSIEPIQEVKQTMSENMETVQVPKSLWEKFEAFFSRLLDREEKRAEPEAEVAEPTEPTEPDNFAAVIAERDEYKTKLETMQAEANHKALVDGFAAQLKETKVGEGAEMLAAMAEEHSAWVIQQFKALSAQINDKALTGEIGDSSEALPDNPRLALDTVIRSRAAQDKTDYMAAMMALAKEQPELFNK